MQTVVADASLLVEFVVAGDDAVSNWLSGQLDGGDLYVVQGLTFLEVSSALRRLVRDSLVDAALAENAHRWLPTLPVKYKPLGQPELQKIWEYRHNLNPYDASYVVLTEALQASTGGNAVLATADAKLARTPRVTCPVVVYPAVET